MHSRVGGLLTDGMLFSVNCLYTILGWPKWKLTRAYVKLFIIQSVSAVTVNSAGSAAVLQSCHLAHCHWDPVTEAYKHRQKNGWLEIIITTRQHSQSSTSITAPPSECKSEFRCLQKCVKQFWLLSQNADCSRCQNCVKIHRQRFE